MKVIKTLQPGAPGTHKHQQQWGDRLLAVRYRVDQGRYRRLTTVEITVEERPLNTLRPPSADEGRVVDLRITFEEYELRARVKRLGGRWRQQQKMWRLPYGKAIKYGLGDRIMGD